MTTQQLATLLQGISSQHVYAFFLVLARLSPLFILAPAFSSTLLPPRARSVVAIGIAVGLTPIAQAGITIPTGTLQIIGLLIVNFVIGIALSYAMACAFAAVQAAGVLADNFSGFSFGQTVDPINGNPGGALTNMYAMVGLALFMALGGDAWMVRGLDATFNSVPINAGIQAKPLVYMAESMFSSVLVGAIEIAAPLMLALIVSDVAFGMVSKVMPQLNVFAVGFPVKVGVALLVVGVSLPFIAGWLSGQLDSSVASAVNALHAL